MTDVYLHVGFPKTGTTFLQEYCLPHLRGIHVVTLRNFSTPTGVTERLWRVTAGYPLFVDMDENRAAMDRFLRGIDEDKVLISSERLAGTGLWGFRDNFQVTDCLRRLLPAAKIILTIRRQDDFLESLYRQAVRNHFDVPIDTYLNYVRHEFIDWYRPPLAFPSINVWHFNYHAYVQNYIAAFGRSNVLVLPYEMLRRDPPRFHAGLAAFMGIDPYYPPDDIIAYRSYSRLSCRIALVLNRFVRDSRREKRPWHVIPDRPPTGNLSHRDRHGLAYRALGAIHQRLTLGYVLRNVVDRIPYSQGNVINDEKRRLIMEIHRESNRRLDEEYSIDLRKYNYY
jgi:hypothetical protein